MKIPVLLLAFNRADHVRLSLAAIRDYQPTKLYLACDGARAYKNGEIEAVEETRKTMLEMVDWPCEVYTLFQSQNLGCANAVNSAISWFFKNEEWGIVIEDDVIVSLDFYKLCEDLLPHYKDEKRIMHINSFYCDPNAMRTNQIAFGSAMRCWGWASWARAWNNMDMTMKSWPNYNISNLYKRLGLFGTIVQSYYWHIDYNNILKDCCSSWATRWNYTILSNNGICISPKVTLSRNIGTDGGTHFFQNDPNPYAHLQIGEFEFPVSYPEKIDYDKSQLLIDKRNFFRVRMLGLKKKLNKIIRKFSQKSK